MMRQTRWRVLSLVMLLAALPAPARGQGAPDASALQAAQREAMRRLAAMDGVWRGEAWTLLPSGERHVMTQTERVGPFLDGTIRVIEGRGYGPDGNVSFNALAVLSYDPATRQYSLRSYAQGLHGDFVLTPTEDGFTWEIPAGPMTIRYHAVLRDGTWTESGYRVTPGREPLKFMEMTLTRVGDSTWPEAGAVPIR